MGLDGATNLSLPHKPFPLDGSPMFADCRDMVKQQIRSTTLRSGRGKDEFLIWDFSGVG